MNWKSLLGAFCFLGALVLSGCGGQTSVQVEKAEIKSIPLTIEINSKAEALHMIPVVPAVSGKIISEIPPAGTKVKQGDLLFQIDSSLYEEQAAALRAQIAASGANSSTSSSSAVDDSMEASLLRQGIITRAEYEKIQARKGFHGVPQAGPGNTGLTESLAALERTIADCMVRAPAGGVVSQNYSGDTKTAAAGRPVLMIQQETPVIFSLALPTKLNEFIEKIKDKKQLTVSVFDSSRHWYGELKKQENDKDDKYTVYKVQADNLDGYIQFGNSYTVRLESRETISAVILPKTALIGENSVAVVTEDSLVDIKTVSVGYETEKEVYILDGLSEGEQVIIHPSDKIEMGMPVKTKIA